MTKLVTTVKLKMFKLAYSVGMDPQMGLICPSLLLLLDFILEIAVLVRILHSFGDFALSEELHELFISPFGLVQLVLHVID